MNRKYNRGYYVCQYCGCALDPGEQCECQTERALQTKKNKTAHPEKANVPPDRKPQKWLLVN